MCVDVAVIHDYIELVIYAVETACCYIQSDFECLLPIVNLFNVLLNTFNIIINGLYIFLT